MKDNQCKNTFSSLLTKLTMRSDAKYPNLSLEWSVLAISVARLGREQKNGPISLETQFERGYGLALEKGRPGPSR